MSPNLPETPGATTTDAKSMTRDEFKKLCGDNGLSDAQAAALVEKLYGAEAEDEEESGPPSFPGMPRPGGTMTAKTATDEALKLALDAIKDPEVRKATKRRLMAAGAEKLAQDQRIADAHSTAGDDAFYRRYPSAKRIGVI